MAIKEKEKIVYKPSPSGKCNYIDFEKTFVDRNYQKTLPQVYTPEQYALELNNYFNSHSKYNIYTLALHFQMDKKRYMKHYVNSDDIDIKSLTHLAMDYITGHAFDNEEEYRRTLKYHITFSETGRHLIELSEEAQDMASQKIVIIPQKEK